jgi:hypothetical protein
MSNPYREIIEKILDEVDVDIKNAMMKWDEKESFPAWCMLVDPANAILQWQALRDRKFLNKNNDKR